VVGCTCVRLYDPLRHHALLRRSPRVCCWCVFSRSPRTAPFAVGFALRSLRSHTRFVTHVVTGYGYQVTVVTVPTLRTLRYRVVCTVYAHGSFRVVSSSRAFTRAFALRLIVAAPVCAVGRYGWLRVLPFTHVWFYGYARLRDVPVTLLPHPVPFVWSFRSTLFRSFTVALHVCYVTGYGLRSVQFTRVTFHGLRLHFCRTLRLPVYTHCVPRGSPVHARFVARLRCGYTVAFTRLLGLLRLVAVTHALVRVYVAVGFHVAFWLRAAPLGSRTHCLRCTPVTVCAFGRARTRCRLLRTTHTRGLPGLRSHLHTALVGLPAHARVCAPRWICYVPTHGWFALVYTPRGWFVLRYGSATHGSGSVRSTRVHALRFTRLRLRTRVCGLHALGCTLDSRSRGFARFTLRWFARGYVGYALVRFAYVACVLRFTAFLLRVYTRWLVLRTVTHALVAARAHTRAFTTRGCVTFTVRYPLVRCVGYVGLLFPRYGVALIARCAFAPRLPLLLVVVGTVCLVMRLFVARFGCCRCTRFACTRLIDFGWLVYVYVGFTHAFVFPVVTPRYICLLAPLRVCWRLPLRSSYYRSAITLRLVAGWLPVTVTFTFVYYAFVCGSTLVYLYPLRLPGSFPVLRSRAPVTFPVTPFTFVYRLRVTGSAGYVYVCRFRSHCATLRSSWCTVAFRAPDRALRLRSRSRSLREHTGYGYTCGLLRYGWFGCRLPVTTVNVLRLAPRYVAPVPGSAPRLRTRSWHTFALLLVGYVVTVRVGYCSV